MSREAKTAGTASADTPRPAVGDGSSAEPALASEPAANGDDYDEEADEDFDPAATKDAASESESDTEQPDYSHITAASSQVRTRSQGFADKQQKKAFANIVSEASRDLNVDEIFSSLKSKSVEGKPTDWTEILGRQEDEAEAEKKTEKRGIFLEKERQKPTLQTDETGDNPKIWINVSYQFAGKIVTESKQVDANSAEAKAYLNSTAALAVQADTQKFRTSVPVIRTIPGTEEPVELKIKLKRPSLIDKFLHGVGSKKQKLSTLEKSRLDWASFVDTNQIHDDLKLHNKAGYLEKQDFLQRLEVKRDSNYEKAREAEKLRQWQEQQKQV